MNKLIWNMFSNIKNAQLANKTMLFQRKNHICFLFLNVLWDEGYILGFQKSILLSQHYEIYLKYNKLNNLFKNYSNIKILYKSKDNIYLNVKQLWKIKLTTETLIVSTSKGLLNHNTCRKYNIGGKPYILLK
jgi:ribosomal protein S8